MGYLELSDEDLHAAETELNTSHTGLGQWVYESERDSDDSVQWQSLGMMLLGVYSTALRLYFLHRGYTR